MAGIAHDSVLAPARASGAEIVGLPVSPDGTADLAALEAALAARAGQGRKILLTLQVANNETGVIQPVAAAAALARAHGAIVHTDAVQAAGRLPVVLSELGVDLLSLTAHKLGGPKGIGALVVRDGTRLPPFLVGGGQERRRRAGTENVIGIAGFAAAAEAARCERDQADRLTPLRDRLEGEVLRLTPQVAIIGSAAPRLPNTSCLAWPGQSAETLVIKLDLAGVAVSAGAACSSGKVGASAVLTAMGLGRELARSAIRLSFGWKSSEADLESFLSAWEGVATSVASRRAVA
jgi:cysteine desulfurase